MPERKHASYLKDLFQSPEWLKAVSDVLVEEFNKLFCRNEITSIVGTGVSGTTTAAMLASRVDVPLCIVRKGASCHSKLRVEGLPGRKYLFVDDCISSGATFRRVSYRLNEQSARFNETTECRVIFLYSEHCRGDHHGIERIALADLIYEKVRPRDKSVSNAVLLSNSLRAMGL